LASVPAFALVPALASSRVNLIPNLKGGGMVGPERGRIGARGWFVAAQFALCLPLLIGSILLIRSARNLYTQDVGFERSQRIQATLDLGGIGYDGERAGALFAALLPAVAAQPGVESAAYSSYGTLAQSSSFRSIYSDVEGSERVSVAMTDVSEGYFETLGIRLLAGRDFTSGDNGSAPAVVIVNESLARALYGDENPLGRQIRYGADSPSGPEIVGVAADSLYNDLREPGKSVVSYPFRQRGLRRTNIYLRTPMGTDAAAALLREQVRELEPYLPVTAVQTLDQQIEAHLQRERLVSRLLTIFGGAALLITAIGLYGVLAFDVSRRTRELGLRQALGAQRREIHALVFRRAVPWVAGGVALGLASSAALSRVIESSLFGVSALDPITFLGAASFLLACAALANYIPARRASRVDPIIALRHE
jgi:predicted permease